MLGGAYIEHPFSIYSAYIQHILKAGGKQVAGREWKKEGRRLINAYNTKNPEYNSGLIDEGIRNTIPGKRRKKKEKEKKERRLEDIKRRRIAHKWSIKNAQKV